MRFEIETMKGPVALATLLATVTRKGTEPLMIPAEGVRPVTAISPAVCEESVMVVINLNDKEGTTVNGGKYAESLEGFTTGTDIISGMKIENLNAFSIAPKTAMIIELK